MLLLVQQYIVLILVFDEMILCTLGHIYYPHNQDEVLQMLCKWKLGKGAVKLFEADTVTGWFYQLYSLYYQDIPENLIWYLGTF